MARTIGWRPTWVKSMKTAILVEKLGANKYRASTSQPISLESEGRSRDEAVKRLCALAHKRLAAGEWQEVFLPGPPDTNPGLHMPVFGRIIPILRNS